MSICPTRVSSHATIGVWHQTQAPSTPRSRRWSNSEPLHTGHRRFRVSSEFTEAMNSGTVDPPFDSPRPGWVLSRSETDVSWSSSCVSRWGRRSERQRLRSRPPSDGGKPKSSGIEERTTPSSPTVSVVSARCSPARGGPLKPSDSKKCPMALSDLASSGKCREISKSDLIKFQRDAGSRESIFIKFSLIYRFYQKIFQISLIFQMC